jgi:hypothetical protein
MGVILMVAVALVAGGLLGREEATVGAAQALLLLLTFVAVFLAALLAGWIARENAVTYGVICGLGAAGVTVLAMPFGIVTLLLSLTALAGGFNGGLMMERANRRRRR